MAFLMDFNKLENDTLTHLLHNYEKDIPLLLRNYTRATGYKNE